MAQLAIKGHPTRGKEVIEILKMLGGISDKTTGSCEGFIYFFDTELLISVNPKNIVSCDPLLYLDEKLVSNLCIFTLEEFLEKYPYKVGDKVIAFGNKCTIIDAIWDESINEVAYTIKLDVSGYTTMFYSN